MELIYLSFRNKKMPYCKKNFFLLTKNYFFKIRKIVLDKMLVRSKFFPQCVEKIEKLKLSLSKQRYKMLKMRSETLKTRKKGKIIKQGKFSWEFSQSRAFLRSRKFSGFPGKFFENFPFPGKLKIWEKGKSSSHRLVACINLHDTYENIAA